jgi:hypothetical protein
VRNLFGGRVMSRVAPVRTIQHSRPLQQAKKAAHALPEQGEQKMGQAFDLPLVRNLAKRLSFFSFRRRPVVMVGAFVSERRISPPIMPERRSSASADRTPMPTRSTVQVA